MSADAEEVIIGGAGGEEEEEEVMAGAAGGDGVQNKNYDNLFPPLPGGMQPTTTPVVNSWAHHAKMYVRSSVVTQVFCVPVEERKYKEMTQNFGEKGVQQQAKICSDIMKYYDVNIEMCQAKDQSLTVVIMGKAERVLEARKNMVQQLQTQATVQIHIPKEHHRFIRGVKSKRLNDLELSTATKIRLPRQDGDDDMIKISGTKEGIEKARHEIQLISDQQAKLAFERLPIPHIYHPFICGPDNSNIEQLMKQTGARISVPPLVALKDELAVAGEKEGVHTCVQAIMQIYQEKKQRCQTVSVEVRKTQHRYVIGTKAKNLSEILALYGVSVEVPPLSSPSETITLRGDQEKLGPALTLVYSKANSVVVEEVEAPYWLHRFIIGRKGTNVKKVTQDLPKVNIELRGEDNKVVVEGPPEEVRSAKDQLIEIVNDLLAKMAFAEIEVDQKYHGHIIGKQGANVIRIKNETGVHIHMPSDKELSNIIRIEGSPEGVAQVKQELLDMVHKMENEKSRDILIEQRFHKVLIGPSGGKIKEIRDKFNQVQITFPDAKLRSSDVVSLRGPKTDVDKAFKYLTQLHTEMIANNHQTHVKIFKQFHKNIIGKGGNTIRKIREETDTRIELPAGDDDSDVITITGTRENVKQACQRIEAIQLNLENISEISIDIPHKFHNSIIGTKGRLIRSIMEECGGVIIRFPPEGSTSDKVIIRGPKDDVENARKQLLEQTNEKKESGHVVEIHCKPEYHKFLIGRGGTNIRKVRDATGARVIFPSASDSDPELITIIGKQESVDQAKVQLDMLISDLDNIVEGEMDVDPRHHRHFVARRGEVLRVIGEEYGGVTVSFPRSGVKSTRVTLKGAKDCVDGAQRRIEEIVADLEAQVTIECVIAQKHHCPVMGAKGCKVQEITKEFEVGIKFPDRPNLQQQQQAPPSPEQDGAAVVMNGDIIPANGKNGMAPLGDDDAPSKCDIITITGKSENCEAAANALQNLVPIIEEISVPFDLHRFIIGRKGGDVRKMMEDHDVKISIPPANDCSDLVRITGAAANVGRASAALKERQEQLELCNFKLEIDVDPKYHPKIIGKKGTVISKIRDSHHVNIRFPDKGSDSPSLIIITGYEAATKAAQTDIEQLVTDLEDMLSLECDIDHRVHSRLIGGRGRAIRNIMNDYKVDIKFPSRDSTTPNLVVITGSEDDVYECRDHLMNLTEEYMQDVIDKEMMKDYQTPTNRYSQDPYRNSEKSEGFVVTGAPWNATPDVSSTTDFPDLGAASAPIPSPSPARNVVWGPALKR